MMLSVSLIAKKRDGHKLTKTEIESFISRYVDGTITDYQMSAMTMAICLRGMDAEETAALTTAMLESGDRLPRIPGSEIPRVDKHSTGGLGDKISLILAPLLAAADFHVPMISGRGLGLTGGTLDKLEAIPGFRVDYEISDTTRLLTESGCCIVAASDRIAPADKRLYALRDVTATVESVALITASILSKKLAASLDALVMDVKVGSAAFMKTEDEARRLADSLVSTGSAAGLPVTAILTDMDQPLGLAVGNAIEVNESIEVLRGGGPSEVRELTLALCEGFVRHFDPNCKNPKEKLERLIDSGAAMERFERMVAAQGGKVNGPLAVAPGRPIQADRSGYVHAIDCRILGETVVGMGGGRKKLGDKIRFDVGLDVAVRIGDQVEVGQPLLTLHCDADTASQYEQTLQNAFEITNQATPHRRLIL